MIEIIRFFCGYVCFEISGTRSGSFVNGLIKRGINVWNIRSCGGKIRCCVSRSDYPEVQRSCCGSSQRVHIIRKRGLPFILNRNKKRSGLAVGFVCFLLVFKLLSLFLWNISFCEFETISQTQARDILRRVGFYEGIPADFESLKRMQTTALLEFGNLSWITLNADGSRGEVNATEKQLPETNDTAPRNMKAGIDGLVIRADAYSGAAVVGSGDAVVEGNLLISGIVETELGGVRAVRADGAVIAQTRYAEHIEQKNKRNAVSFDEAPKTRYSLRLFGVVIPLTLCRTDESSLLFRNERQAEFLGERASASVIEENIYSYHIEEHSCTGKEIELMLRNETALRELFCYSDKLIIDRRIEDSADQDLHSRSIYYTCEEDIARPSALLVDSLKIYREETEE